MVFVLFYVLIVFGLGLFQIADKIKELDQIIDELEKRRDEVDVYFSNKTF